MTSHTHASAARRRSRQRCLTAGMLHAACCVARRLGGQGAEPGGRRGGQGRAAAGGRRAAAAGRGAVLPAHRAGGRPPRHAHLGGGGLWPRHEHHPLVVRRRGGGAGQRLPLRPRLQRVCALTGARAPHREPAGGRHEQRQRLCDHLHVPVAAVWRREAQRLRPLRRCDQAPGAYAYAPACRDACGTSTHTYHPCIVRIPPAASPTDRIRPE